MEESLIKNCKNNDAKIYHYGKYSFASETTPKCNLCGGDLIFKNKKNGEIKIVSCSNNECEYNNTKSLIIKQKAILPIEKFKEVREQQRRCRSTNVYYWIDRGYSMEEAKKIIHERQSKASKQIKGQRGLSREGFEEKYGKNIKSFFRKRSIWCVEYWLEKGYTEEEAKKKVSEFQTKMNERRVLKYSNKELAKKINPRCVEYWLEKGYTEEEAKKTISELQRTFSLEKCIKKYGEIEGRKRWEKRQRKWQKTLNDRGFHQLGCSNVSQELFSIIESKYPEDERDFLFYENKNKEYTLKNESVGFFRYDFCDLNKRKFIEFNGDIYHANPLLFNENDKPNPYKNATAKELWEYDEQKKDIAIKNGFKELIIWEKEYKENKEETIKKCIDFLRNE